MTTPPQAPFEVSAAAGTQHSAGRFDPATSDRTARSATDACATFVCDLDGTITHGDEAFATLFCGDSGSPVGASLREYPFDGDDSETVEELLTRVSNGESVRRELSLSTATGDRRQFRFEATPIEADGVQLVVGVCLDLTARVRADRKQQLFAAVSRAIGTADTYRAGLEQTLEAMCTYTEWAYGEVWTPDPDAGVLTYTLGYTDDPELAAFQAASESVTFDCGAGLPGRVYDSQSVEWLPDVSTEPPDVFHRRSVAAEVGVRAALAVPVVADGRVVAVLAFFLRERRAADESLAADVADVAASLGGLVDHRQTERLVRQRNERLEEFAAVVSHDLRNPLNVASGTLAMVREERDSERLATVATAHDRMEQLIADVLTLARQGKTVDSLVSIRLAEVVTDCWRIVDTADATLSVETDRVLRADRSRLRQIVANLFRNSVEHAGPAVGVTVGDFDTGFYIEDDGPGIDAADRDQVFDPGHTTSTDGNGLGLSIVREIVEAHGWSISVTESPDGGARFEITNVECGE